MMTIFFAMAVVAITLAEAMYVNKKMNLENK